MAVVNSMTPDIDLTAVFARNKDAVQQIAATNKREKR